MGKCVGVGVDIQYLGRCPLLRCYATSGTLLVALYHMYSNCNGIRPVTLTLVAIPLLAMHFTPDDRAMLDIVAMPPCWMTARS